jgi:hypothetical protein
MFKESLLEKWKNKDERIDAMRGGREDGECWMRWDEMRCEAMDGWQMGGRWVADGWQMGGRWVADGGLQNEIWKFWEAESRGKNKMNKKRNKERAEEEQQGADFCRCVYLFVLHRLC